MSSRVQRHDAAPIELGPTSVRAWLAGKSLFAIDADLEIAELAGGVSGTVLSVRGRGFAVVVKQALPRLRVTDEWFADPSRSETEVAALRLVGALTPDSVPRVLAHDPENHIFAIEHLPESARNWQAEIDAGRVHAHLGAWAGRTLAAWHTGTLRDESTRARFAAAADAFEALRLRPFYNTTAERLPHAAQAIHARADELRRKRMCIVDGDFAPKNVLVDSDRKAWKLDLEVAHFGNPIFDLAFFLSFVALSAVQWPAHRGHLEKLGNTFTRAYRTEVPSELQPEDDALAAHTACLMLARTDGVSPAAFLDPRGRARARDCAIALLLQPQLELWRTI